MWLYFSILFVLFICDVTKSQSTDVIRVPRTLSAQTYVANLTRRHGYPMERHETETSDGYIVTMYLMPQKGAARFESKTVFLSHGLMSSSDCFFMNHPSEILPFKLYDAGYNVMLGNFRGTSHSMRHIHFPPNSPEFWDFSWDELGRLDVAAMIDYTLEILHQKKLFLIGHSMGSTTGFVLLSERPEYNEKLYHFIALAPALFEFHNSQQLLKWTVPLLFYPNVNKIFSNYIAPPNGMFPIAHAYLNKLRLNCVKAIVGKNPHNLTIHDQRWRQACRKAVSMLGIDADKVGQEGFETMVSVPIETSSLRTALHYTQNMRSRYFRKYDFGGIINLKKYGTKLPPDYNLKKVTCPTTLFWAKDDEFASQLDVKDLVRGLRKSKSLKVNEITVKPWNHFEYILSKSAAHYLNPIILNIINSTET